MRLFSATGRERHDVVTPKYINAQIRYGLFARQTIEPGQIIATYRGVHLNAKQAQELENKTEPEAGRGKFLFQLTDTTL